MKKLISTLLTLMLGVLFVSAQRYAVIDSRYILNKMPDYKEAQTKLDQISNLWQQEIEQKQTALNKMQKDFEAEQVILPEHLQKKRFGFEGDLFKKRQELIKPIQDKIYNAVQKLALDKQYDFILDKSEGITVIFVDPKLDKSEDIIKALGVK
jgi:outer membrane protein